MGEVETVSYTMQYLRAIDKILPKGRLTIERFVLKHGRDFEFATHGYAFGRMKECFANAFNLMISNSETLIYCEGYATSVIPTLHGWCATKDGMRVVDNTWDDGRDYFGVPFKEEFVIQTIVSRKHYGVIDNYEQRFPLLTGEITDFLYQA